MFAKLINKFFKFLENDRRRQLEKYILSRHPKTVADIDHIVIEHTYKRAGGWIW